MKVSLEDQMWGGVIRVMGVVLDFNNQDAFFCVCNIQL